MTQEVAGAKLAGAMLALTLVVLWAGVACGAAGAIAVLVFRTIMGWCS